MEQQDARAKLAAKFGENVRLGGKGSIRRKKKVERKGTAADEKKLQGALKRLGVQPIPQFEEVNLFCDDNSVIHFTNPNV